MAKRRKMIREKLYKKIMFYSHEMGKEITKNDIYDMFDSSEMDTMDETEALEDMYNQVFKEYLDHKLPSENAKD